MAEKLVDKREIDEAKTILADDFIAQVQNLLGIHISPEAADILIKSAEYILPHLYSVFFFVYHLNVLNVNI